MRLNIDKSSRQKIGIKTILFLSSVLIFNLVCGSLMMALALLSMIFIHECGHLWAARRRGLETGGIYFLPGIGGAAIIKSAGTREDECYVSIMGPIWGGFVGVAYLLVNLITGIEFFGLAAFYIALINLFNLFPINPLDGGRIAKSILLSLHRKLGIAIMMCMIITAVAIAVTTKLWIFIFIAVIGALELIHEWKGDGREEMSEEAVNKMLEDNPEEFEGLREKLDEASAQGFKLKFMALRENMRLSSILKYIGCSFLVMVFLVAIMSIVVGPEIIKLNEEAALLEEAERVIEIEGYRGIGEKELLESEKLLRDFIMGKDNESSEMLPFLDPDPTPEATEIEKNRYRFGGRRYGLRGPSRYLDDEMIPDEPSLITSPRPGA